MDVQVVSLAAWCDMRTFDEYRAELAEAAAAVEQPLEPGWAPYVPDDNDDEVEQFNRGLHFQVEEFATLTDGRRVTLSNDRGWSMSGVLWTGLGPPDPAYEDPWAHMTVENVERDTLNVVLPDDAEQTGDEHPWELFVERLADLGVTTTRDELRALPYEVILSPRLRERLSAEVRPATD